MAAWDQGCKGCTTYRPNAVTGSVLTVAESNPRRRAPPGGGWRGRLSVRAARPAGRAGGADLQAEMAGVSEHALYITINDIVIAGHRRPFEVFINSKNMEHYAWTVALTRMISAVFRGAAMSPSWSRS
jgi:ribonucleoside-diphosphate reductase alpha chain